MSAKNIRELLESWQGKNNVTVVTEGSCVTGTITVLSGDLVWLEEPYDCETRQTVVKINKIQTVSRRV